jgi:hypothetical protein
LKACAGFRDSSGGADASIFFRAFSIELNGGYP